jgi:hypothetical protein
MTVRPDGALDDRHQHRGRGRDGRDRLAAVVVAVY